MSKSILTEQIKRIKTLIESTNSKTEHPYSCVMVYFDDQPVKNVLNEINPLDLYVEEPGFGLETEPHCTLLFGLHEDEVRFSEIKSVINQFEIPTCRAFNLSLFNNPKYDILKYDIEGDNLRDINFELCKFPHTSDFPDYHPHMTIAYLKKGMGDSYVDRLNKIYPEFNVTPTHNVYSKKDGEKLKF